MPTLTTRNDGPRILASDYWGGEYDAAGYAVMDGNAGAVRLLLPTGMDGVADMRAARGVAITVGRHAQLGREMVEILFDDGSDAPFALYLAPEACSRLPGKNRSAPFLVYGPGPELLIETVCAVRRAQLPHLAPWRSP